MATTVETNVTPTPTPPPPVRAPQPSTPWYQNQRLLVTGGGGLLLAAAVGYFVVASGKRKEEFAARTLEQAQAAADAGNVPLASSELQKVITTYKGTGAASEAVLALNQIRLHNDQAELAVSNLKEFMGTNPDPRYGVPAAGMLAAALESAKRWTEAGDAYMQAAEKAQQDYLKATYLNAAGRVYALGGQADKAIKAYGTVLAKYAETPGLVEAQLRLAELTDGKQGEVPAGATATK